MAGSESVQRILTRVRPPRVKITYDVEIGNAIEKKELPFIVGILMDLAGDPPTASTEEPVEGAVPPKAAVPLKDRPFIEIDRDNFDTVLQAIGPKISIKVANHLNGKEGGDVTFPLKFEKIDDFRPESLILQVKELKDLLEKRNDLRDLLTKSDGSDKWAKLIDRTIDQNAAVQKALPPPPTA
jgi:type VI secretion system protein ImpB